MRVRVGSMAFLGEMEKVVEALPPGRTFLEELGERQGYFEEIANGLKVIVNDSKEMVNNCDKILPVQNKETYGNLVRSMLLKEE